MEVVVRQRAGCRKIVNRVETRSECVCELCVYYDRDA